jgi:Uncharacterised nucleotidyltransferase
VAATNQTSEGDEALWSSDVVCGLLELATGLTYDTRADVLADAAPEKLRVVLASAWASEGIPIGAVAGEVEFWREQVDRYRRHAEKLTAEVPEAVVLRGPAIAELYPAGWVRDCSDLDVVVPAQAELWAACRLLMESGWTCNGVSVMRSGRDLEFAMSFSRPSSEPLLLDFERIEISTAGMTGNFLNVPPTAKAADYRGHTTASRNLLAMLEERLERCYRARDVLDTLLLLERLPDAEAERFLAAVARADLWPEWRELSRRVSATADVSLPGAGGSRGRLRSLASNARRRVRTARRTRAPAVVAWTLATRWTLGRLPSRRQARIVSGIHRAIGPARVLDRGLPLFGVSTDDSPAHEVRITTTNGRPRLECPVGTFLLDYIPESAAGSRAS